MNTGSVPPFNKLIEFSIIAIHGIELSVDPSDYGWHEFEGGNYHRLVAEFILGGEELSGQAIVHEDKLLPFLNEKSVTIDRINDNTLYFGMNDQKQLDALRSTIFIGVYAGDFEINNHPNMEEYLDSMAENHTFYLLGIEEQ